MGHSKDEKEESDGKVDDHEAQKSMDETNYSSDHDVHDDDDVVGNKTKQSQQTCPDRSKPLLSSKTTITSATGAPPPTELLRAQGGIIISRPGAMHISGNSRVQDNDEESAVQTQTTSGLSPPAPQQDVLISAELVQQTPQEANTDITAEVTPAPTPTPPPPVATIPKPSSQPLVHAEPFQEREIGLREILKNRTVRITLAVCVVLIVFIVAVVVGVVLSMQKQDNHPFQEQGNPQDKKTRRPSTPPRTTTYHPSGPPNGSGSQSYSSSGNSGNETGGSGQYGNETGGGSGKHGNETGR